MVGVDDVIKAVEWVADIVNEPAGTAVVRSDKANWKQDPDDMSHFELSRAHALTVTAYRTNAENNNPFSVTAELEGGFSAGVQPAQMRDVTFHMGHHNTGDGTSLAVDFTNGGSSVDQLGDRFILLWSCAGHFKIRHDVEVDFRSRFTVDTNGHVNLEAPFVNPASGTSYTYEGSMAIEWQWEAVLGMFGHPQLAIAFTRMTPSWG